MTWRQFRPIEQGEFFVAFADTAAGGRDNSACAFFSTTHMDFPLLYHSNRVATEMTNSLHPVLEKLHDLTGIAPVIAYETNFGGVFELERLGAMNRGNKYRIYNMKKYGSIDNGEETKIGWNTNTATRPKMLTDWKEAVDKLLVTIYDKPTLAEHYSFIISKSGKPEAETSANDDLVMSYAGAYQLYQTERPIIVGSYLPYNRKKWVIQ